MSLCMWDVYILFSNKVLLNFQCGDLFFCIGCGVSPMPLCAITPLWSVNLSLVWALPTGWVGVSIM